MSDYERKIIYLSEMRDGIKAGSAGFLRLETRAGESRLDMHVSGLAGVPEQAYMVTAQYSAEGARPVGRIFLRMGKGEWKEALSAAGLKSISVDLSGDRSILAAISERNVETVKVSKENEPSIKRGIFKEEKAEKSDKTGKSEKAWPTDRSGQENIRPQADRNGQENVRPQADRNGQENIRPQADRGGQENICSQADRGGQENINPKAGRICRQGKMFRGKKSLFSQKLALEETGTPQERASLELKAGSLGEWQGPEGTEQTVGPEGSCRTGGMQADQVILSDKWEQLKRLYPVVHPYEDHREYLSIAPRDFVIMTGDCQHLANNSFLLHGYYNYRHLVLGPEKALTEPEKGSAKEPVKDRWGSRETEQADHFDEDPDTDRTENVFYLGVPGVYYEREKMVALMFGFEAFECVGGKAEAGTFGYYLRRVSI